MRYVRDEQSSSKAPEQSGKGADVERTRSEGPADLAPASIALFVLHCSTVTMRLLLTLSEVDVP